MGLTSRVSGLLEQPSQAGRKAERSWVGTRKSLVPCPRGDRALLGQRTGADMVSVTKEHLTPALEWGQKQLFFNYSTF